LKTRIALLIIACLVLAVAPAMADTLYDNGPINGQVDAWTINFGFSVTDSFTCSHQDCSVEDFHIGVWLTPGDTLSSVEMQLGSASFGNQYTDQVLNATGQTNLFINNFGLQIALVDFSLSNIDVPNGTSWITLQNAVTPSGDPVYWDENGGSSSAFENTLGSIPSEAFTITGTATGTTGTTPEPSSIMLFGSGILGLAGVLRRKLTR
jgi:PEP-CTERM motif